MTDDWIKELFRHHLQDAPNTDVVTFARTIEAAARAEQRKEDVRLLREVARDLDAADWLESQPC